MNSDSRLCDQDENDNFDVAEAALKLTIESFPSMSDPILQSIENFDEIEDKTTMNNDAVNVPLLLIDMNGTILFRSHEIIPDLPHHLFFNGRYYYCRPYLSNLLENTNIAAGFKLGFYTSMQKGNAQAALDYMFGKGNEIPLYAQEFNKRDPCGEKSWSMMRDMDRIWQLKNTIAFNHSAANTLMIDDSPLKMREYPDNVLVVPEFTLDGVLSGNDEVLQRLSICLDDILNFWSHGQRDIRDIVRLRRPDYERFLAKNVEYL